MDKGFRTPSAIADRETAFVDWVGKNRHRIPGLSGAIRDAYSEAGIPQHSTGRGSSWQPHPTAMPRIEQKVLRGAWTGSIWDEMFTPEQTRKIGEYVRQTEAAVPPKQLQFWMPAEELAEVAPGDAMRGQSRNWQDLWADKLEETKHRTQRVVGGQRTGAIREPLHGDIAKRGVTEPVWVGHRELGRSDAIIEGHHRIAAAKDVNPRMEVPVEYVDAEKYGRHDLTTRKGLMKIVPNKKLVTQLMQFGRTVGEDGLMTMLRMAARK